MKTEHLGDAFDHWKGSIIQRLESRNLLKDIAVIPMLTDSSWDNQKEKISAYSHLLNLKANKVLQTGKFSGNKHNRERYFEIGHAGDLFLDPDTGVSISSSSNNAKHITISQIEKLLDHDRVILVYQHRGREKCLPQRIVGRIRHQIKRLNSVTYDCGNVAMLFFSYDRDRIEKIKNYIKEDMLSGAHLNRVKML